MAEKNLIILEIANNHMGDLSHGIRIVREFGDICKDTPDFQFSIKLQYRDLDTFIHDSFKSREDIKYVKRFSEAKLSRTEFDKLIEAIREYGFKTIVTPFDEPSVRVIEEQEVDMIKIASCSFTDWPLLERIAANNNPIIASTAGASLDEIDRVVSYFMHRNKKFSLLHCVGEYPTPPEHANLSQIDLLRSRYAGIDVGYSTHEDPDNTELVKLAVAKGAVIFEKHVGIQTDKYPLNAYSANPNQIAKWIEAIRQSKIACGLRDQRISAGDSEKSSLDSLRRGMFAKKELIPGQFICNDDVYFAFPPEKDQVLANDWSKYTTFCVKKSIDADAPIYFNNLEVNNFRSKVVEIAQKVKAILKESSISVPGGVYMEISHHYGMELFTEFGLVMLTIVNRGYCKKLLIMLPGQSHPEQLHKQKEETFHLLYGQLDLTLNGESRYCSAGDVITIEPGIKHTFFTSTGAVIEEISSTHFKDDSFYTDNKINLNKNRKTLLTYWME